MLYNLGWLDQKERRAFFLAGKGRGLVHTIRIDEWDDVKIVLVKHLGDDAVGAVATDELVGEILDHLDVEFTEG